jgi:caffeoyl-CoA O-methyltransferase
MADVDSRAGHTYHKPAILGYLARVHAPHDEALERAFTAPERTGLPAIQVGPSEGRLVGMLAGLVSAKKVVEVGTLAGYSAIWLGRALPEDGKLYTLEKDPHAAQVATANIAHAGLAHKVEVVLGDAVDSLARLEREGPFCMVFVDADKGRYDVYGRWALAHLRSGGLLVGDNAFFFGDLLDESKDAARAMRAFHEEMAASFESVCIPTPDGLAVGRKR